MTTEIEIASGPAPTPAPPPAADLVGAWLAGRKPTTVAGYTKDLAHFARFLKCGSGREAAEALLGLPAGRANEVVLAWRNEQDAAGLSSATIARRLAAVRSLVKLARMLGRVEWTIEVASLAAEPRRDMRGPDADAVRRIRRVLKARSKMDRALWCLLYGMGLRRAEVAGLALGDVDFIGGRLYVLGKGRREKTALTLADESARALAEWVAVRGATPGPLFHKTGGVGERRPLDPGTINRKVAAIGQAAGLATKLRPHGARHAAITELFRRQKTVAEVMGFSRHARPETVMKYHDELTDAGAALTRELDKTLG